MVLIALMAPCAACRILQQEGAAATELVKNLGSGADSLGLNPGPSVYCVTLDKVTSSVLISLSGK